jgi:4-aminobutyrate aminotransferase / (S)-3-amino-2-methylpropionate transaminase / 5-aminovalerate transaminase
MELVADRGTRAPDKALTARVLAAALARGLVLLSAGTFGNVIRVLAPLTADDELIDEGLGALEAALVAAVGPDAAPSPWSPIPGRAPSTN